MQARTHLSCRGIALACGLLSVPVLALPGCGGTSSTSPSAPLTGSDEHQITQLIKDYGAQPTLLCTRFAASELLQRQFGSRSNCLRLASSPAAKDPGVRVSNVTVHGSRATAIRTAETNPGKGTRARLTLSKQSGQWRVLTILAVR